MMDGRQPDPHMQKIGPIGLVGPSVAREAGRLGACGSVSVFKYLQFYNYRMPRFGHKCNHFEVSEACLNNIVRLG